MQNDERRGPQEPWGFGLFGLAAALREWLIRWLLLSGAFLAAVILGTMAALQWDAVMLFASLGGVP